ncbi:MAG: hypothetical protein ACOC0E_06920 [Spirochaetota bacterium]
MRPANRAACLILAVFLIFVAVSGCRRSRERADDGLDDSDPVAGADRESGGEGSMGLTEEGRRRMDPPSAVGDAAGAQPENGREDGLTTAVSPASEGDSIDPRDTAFAGSRLAAAALYPNDFVLGSLRTSGLSRLEYDARRAAMRVLEQAVGSGGSAGSVPSTIEERPGLGVRAAFERLVSEAREADFVRVSRPAGLPTGELSFPFRFVAESDSWVGELVLEMSDGRWYTSDVQVHERGADRVETFVPGVDTPAANW